MNAGTDNASLDAAWQILLALVFAGGLGGLVRSIIEDTRTDNVITLPVTRQTVALGWVGDALVGGCAAIVAYTFFNVLGATPGQTVAPDIVRLAGFGIASGYAGARILNAMLDKFPQEKLDLLAAKQDALRLYDAGKYSMAAKKFREIVAADPSDIQSKANLALALSYMGEDGVKEALSLLGEVVKAEPKNDEAWYNIACIRAVARYRHFSDQEVFDALRKAFEINPDWKSYLKTDKDFNRFRAPPSEEYKSLTGDTATKPLD